MTSPQNPSKYLGPNVYIANTVIRSRRPTSADYRQPETGKLYVPFAAWQVGKDPTTGVEGELWMLSKIVSNQAYWVMVGSSGETGIDSIQVQTATSPGVNPVQPNSNGLVTISGTIVAAHSVPIETHTRALNTCNLEIQLASLVSPTPANSNNVGLACFNTNQFQLDATSGMVSLKGSTTIPAVLSLTADTGGPISPNSSGNISLLGGGASTGVVTAGSSNQIDHSVYRWAPPAVNNWTPNVVGASVAGTATYIKQHGVFSRIGNMIFFTFDLEWSSHTGSGDMLITGFPKQFALTNTNYPYMAYVENITLPTGTIQVVFNGENSQTFGQVQANIDADVAAPVTLGSGSGTICCYGFYFSDQA